MSEAPPQVKMVSWRDGHAFGFINKVETLKPEISLIRLHQLRERGGRKYGFAILRTDHVIETGEQRRIWLRYIPVRCHVAANMLFAEAHVELEREQLEATAAQSSHKPDPTAKARWRSLKKGFPETAARMSELATASADQKEVIARRLWRAFVLETFRETGHLLAPVEPDEWRKIALLADARRKRKRPPIDPIETALILDWMDKGYCHKKPSQLIATLKADVGYAPTVEALRKIISRRKLPTFRLAGRPKK